MIMERNRADRYDTIIVGARCAGAALAMLLARAGQRVLAIERMAYGTDTLSSHALMRSAVKRLARWRLLDALSASGAPLIDATTFHYGADTTRVEIKKDQDVRGLIAPRRYMLDAVLVDAARNAGADILHDTIVTQLCPDPTGTDHRISIVDGAGKNRTVSASFVVGADGVNSFVARSFRAPIISQGHHAAAHVYGYIPWRGSEYHWYFEPGASASLIPTNNREACLVASVPASQFESVMRPSLSGGWTHVIEKVAPDIADLARSVKQPLRAFRGRPGIIRQAHGKGWALLGDAGFFRDPLTAHGISDALRDAEWLAEALTAGHEDALAQLEVARRPVMDEVLRATDAIASFSWSLADLPALHRAFSEAMKRDFFATNWLTHDIGHQVRSIQA